MGTFRKWGIALCLTTCLANSAWSAPLDVNAISLELLGTGGIYSLRYDRMLHSRLAVGGGLSGLTDGTNGFWALPAYVNYYLFNERHRLYLTGGVSLAYVDLDLAFFWDLSRTEWILNGGFGYEFRGRGGFLFRATPYLLYLASADSYGTPKFAPWVGLTFGYAF